MGGIIGEIFGTSPQQQGTAADPNQTALGNSLLPWMQQIIGQMQGGGSAYNVPNVPNAPGVPDYNVTPYQSTQAPYGSPQDMIQSGEMNTAQNLMQQFYSGGGGGSAMGGLSGQGQGVMGNVLGNLAQGAVGRYAQMQLPYDQMQNQQSRDVWGQQNNIWGQQMNQDNLGYQGQMQQWQAQNQAMNPYQMFAQMPTTYGSPMVGEEGVMSRYFNFWDNAF